MYKELCLYNNQYLNREQQISSVFQAISKDFNGVNVSLPIMRHISEYVPKNHIIYSVPIDYPNGDSDLRVRQHASIMALRSGANAIDLVPSKYLIKEGKFLELVNDIKAHISICKDYNASLRLFMDYGHLDINELKILSRIYKELHIEYVLPALGYHNDDILDNLIAAKIIHEVSDIDIISNGYVWTTDQLDLVKNSNIFGLRLYSLILFN